MVLKFVESIIFLASGSMSSTGKSRMSPSLAVVTLENAWVHVCGLDSGDKSTKIEEMINQKFGFGATLRVLYVKLDDSHIIFGRYFDNSWFGCKGN